MSTKRYTPDMIQIIVSKWKEGYSASQIAENMSRRYNMEFTRNMILGKIWRLRKSGIDISC